MGEGARRVELDELVADTALPYVRHTAGGTTFDAAWVLGSAVLLHGPTHTTVLGPPTDAGPLMSALVGAPGLGRLSRLSVVEESVGVVPPAWRYEPLGHWHWMRTRTAPELGPRAWSAAGGTQVAARVVDDPDPAEVDAVLDRANPGSHARPGTPGLEGWLGVRVADRLVGVGAVRRDPAGSGHLCGIAVAPEVAGHGLGTLLSAALTRRAMDRPPHVATLGVYVDNERAIGIYRRLGYVVEHTFVSGRPGGDDGPGGGTAQVRSSAITTAAAPSR